LLSDGGSGATVLVAHEETLDAVPANNLPAVALLGTVAAAMVEPSDVARAFPADTTRTELLVTLLVAIGLVALTLTAAFPSFLTRLVLKIIAYLLRIIKKSVPDPNHDQ
jgi:hypothetical protein